MLEQLRETWERLDRRQQVSLAAVLVVMLGALIAVGVWATRPTWTVLYGELSPQDAEAVVEELREQGVPYRLAAAGTTVEVPQERLYELRLHLAGEGLPGSGSVGFELFDRTSFSTSDLQNNVNLQRALQGELERSVCTLEEIATARVHLALPEERLFSEQQEPPSASVVVGLGGNTLGTAQVSAITQLVASAVPSLQPDTVTVVDTAGRVLSGGWDGGGGLQTMAQVEATRAYEERLRAHLQTMLDSVLGAHKSVVRVQAALDFQRRQVTREILQPPDGSEQAAGEGMVTREEITSETYAGEGDTEIGGPAGITGERSATLSGEGGSYEHTSEQREYDYSREQEHVTRPPGEVQRLTIAVVVDESLDASVSDQVQELVQAAAGIDEERGDMVTVESMAIDAIRVAEEEQKLAEAAEQQRQRQRTIQRVTRYGSVILMLAMIAGAMLMVSRRFGSGDEDDGRREENEERADAAEESSEAKEVTEAGDDSDEPEEALEFSAMTVEELQEEVDGPEGDLARELSAFGSRSPDGFARHLRGWMQPDEGEDKQGDGEQ